MMSFGQMNNSNKAGVYAITLVTDGRRYVGSAKNFRNRWHVHKSHLRSGKHHSRALQRAWNKYGEAAFEFSILEIVGNLENLIQREQFYLDKIYYSRKSFNGNPVAGSSLGRVLSQETKNKIAKKAKGRKVGALARAHMSAAHRGKKKSDEHRAKLAAHIRERAKLPVSKETRERMSAAARLRVSRSARRKDGTFGAERGVEWSEPMERAA